MSAFDVRLVALALVALALALARTRGNPRSMGLVAGVALTGLGLAFAVDGAGLGLRVDAVSLPRVFAAGLGLTAVFAVLPRRHGSAWTTATLVLLALAHLGLVLLPAGWPVLAAWVASCALTGAALTGPARRLALPYLLLALGAGASGLVLGGGPGQALLVLAVAVRLGVFPFHSWVVGSYAHAPMAVAVAISAPMGAIGLLARAPVGFDGPYAALALGGLSVAACLAAGLALVQERLDRSLGLLGTSIATLVYLGVLDADHVGHTGGLMMWSVTSLALTGLGLVGAALVSRLGAVRVDRYAGLLDHTPALATLFLVFAMTAVGAPGTADFASEDLVLHGGLAHHPVMLVLFVAAVSAQAYAAMQLFFRVYFGPPRAGRVADALPRERLVLFALAAVLVLAGLAPQLLLGGWLPAAGELAVHGP